MLKDLRQSFFQVFTASFLWIVCLLSIFFNGEKIQVMYLWNLVGVAASIAFLCGVVYKGLWQYLTFKPLANVVISSILNSGFGLAAVYLFSEEMFAYIASWIPGMLVLSLALHFVAFYIYAKYEAKKNCAELNHLLKK
ncbi:hypothetical protein [Enterococcus sp. LJL51]|uniref:hypothetical protein n=1 Tax=Enterococcus sp. LJL51 TaxID=3416656 RepID=UPI003CFB6731